eukprot:scaffold13781_cov93-Phaeocystis_antarctica.AAC.4
MIDQLDVASLAERGIRMPRGVRGAKLRIVQAVHPWRHPDQLCAQIGRRRRRVRAGRGWQWWRE